MIGYAFCGSFCTLAQSLRSFSTLCRAGYDIQPIMSEAVYERDTRFFAAKDFRRMVTEEAGREIIHTVEGAEPLGHTARLDFLIVAPCTGNTLAKIAHGITDTAVTMAVKAHLRCDGKTLIALASNDAMSQNLSSIATLINRKSVYMVPMCQDNPIGKPHSLVADFSRLEECFIAAMEGVQVRPVFC